MDDQILKQVEKINSEKLWKINNNASKQMKRLGVACLSLVLVDVLLAIFVTRFSFLKIMSITVCFLTAIFNFKKSKAFAKKSR